MLYSLSVVESKSSGGRKGIKASSCYSLKSPSLPGAIAGLMTGCHVSVQCCHMEHQPTSREVAITMSAQSTPHTDCALKDLAVALQRNTILKNEFKSDISVIFTPHSCQEKEDGVIPYYR